MLKTRKLRLVPAPVAGTPGVLVPTVPGPLVTRGGRFDFVCAGCGYLLAHAVEPEELRAVTIKCFRCGAFNGTAAAARAH